MIVPTSVNIMCSNLPIIRIIPLEQSNLAIFCLYDAFVDSYIYGIFYDMCVESTPKMYQYGIPYKVYGVSTGNH